MVNFEILFSSREEKGIFALGGLGLRGEEGWTKEGKIGKKSGTYRRC